MSAAGTKKLKTSAMIASFADSGQKTAAAPFGHALAQLAEEDARVVGLSADLAKYTDMHIFRDAHPERFFQMGMAEQLLSVRPPGWLRSASSRSRRPTRSSRPGERTTSSASTSRSPSST